MRKVQKYIQNLREVFQISPEGILVTDLNGKVVFLNKNLLDFCQISEQLCLGKLASQLFKDFDPNVEFKTLVKRKAVFKDLPFKLKNNKQKKVSSLLILIETETDPIGQIFICRLEENHIPENPYSNKSNPIVRVLNSKKNEVWFISDVKNYTTAFCSDRIEQISGWTAKEFTFGSWSFSFILIHPQDRTRVMGLLNDAVALRNENKIIYDHVPMTVKFRFRSRQNNWLWFEDAITVLDRDESGMIRFMIGSIRLINPNQENQEALKLIQENIIIKDGKTYVNIDTLLEIQKNNIQNNVSTSEMLVESFHLTNRELEILAHIVDGLSSDEISNKIHITINTVNMHRKQIMKKMQAKNLADLVRKSVENGLFSKNVSNNPKNGD